MREHIYDLGTYAAVGAMEDGDNGAAAKVLLIHSRACNAEYRIIFRMDAAHARQIARRLKRYADFLDPPKPRRVR